MIGRDLALEYVGGPEKNSFCMPVCELDSMYVCLCVCVPD